MSSTILPAASFLSSIAKPDSPLMSKRRLVVEMLEGRGEAVAGQLEVAALARDVYAAADVFAEVVPCMDPKAAQQ